MMNFRASPDGSLLAVGQSRGGLKNSGVIELISAISGEQVMLLTVLEAAKNQRPGIVQSQFEFSPDGQHLAVAIRGRLQVWDLMTGELVADISDADEVRHVAISVDAAWVAGVRPQSPVQLWNVTDPTKSFLLEPADSTQAVRFSPDGQELAAQLSGGRLRVWRFGSQSRTKNAGRS
jgi:WD40 repeat protein